eukprot:473353_1
MQQLTDDAALFPKLKHICHQNEADIRLWKNQLFFQIWNKRMRKAIVKQMESIIQPICSERELRRLFRNDESNDNESFNPVLGVQLLSNTLKRLKEGFVCRRTKP